MNKKIIMLLVSVLTVCFLSAQTCNIQGVTTGIASECVGDGDIVCDDTEAYQCQLAQFGVGYYVSRAPAFDEMCGGTTTPTTTARDTDSDGIPDALDDDDDDDGYTDVEEKAAKTNPMSSASTPTDCDYATNGQSDSACTSVEKLCSALNVCVENVRCSSASECDGYACLAGACAQYCAIEKQCDTASGYTCTIATGVCETVSSLDTDGDGIPDVDDTDDDNDGLSDDESMYKTDPLDPDTDNDGVMDGEEVIYETNPLNEDSYPECTINEDCTFPTPFCSSARVCVECLGPEYCNPEYDCIDNSCVAEGTSDKVYDLSIDSINYGSNSTPISRGGSNGIYWGELQVDNTVLLTYRVAVSTQGPDASDVQDVTCDLNINYTSSGTTTSWYNDSIIEPLESLALNEKEYSIVYCTFDITSLYSQLVEIGGGSINSQFTATVPDSLGTNELTSEKAWSYSDYEETVTAYYGETTHTATSPTSKEYLKFSLSNLEENKYNFEDYIYVFDELIDESIYRTKSSSLQRVTRKVSEESGNIILGFELDNSYDHFVSYSDPTDGHLSPTQWIIVQADVKNEEDNVKEEDFIIGKLSDTCGQPLYALQDTADGKYKFTVSIDGTVHTIKGGTVTDDWQTVKGSYDGDTLELSVDGDSVKSTSVSGAIALNSKYNEKKLWIGYSQACEGTSNGAIPFGGYLDDIYIYGE